MQEKTVLRIASRMAGITEERYRAEQIEWEEGGGAYRVWRLTGDGQSFILKESSARELEIYRAMSGKSPHVPLVFGETVWRGKPWILMEDLQGKNLSDPTRDELALAVDALIDLQRPTWNSSGKLGESMEESLTLRRIRRRYLPGIGLKLAFDRVMREYRTAPTALGHDDLLPQNVLICGDRAVLIDWEYGGMLPYPVMLARLIAHGSETGLTPFHLGTGDKQFAIDRYYERFVRFMGVARGSYDYTMDCFLFYEMTEWVYVYRKTHKRPDEFYRSYLAEAKMLARGILKGEPVLSGKRYREKKA